MTLKNIVKMTGIVASVFLLAAAGVCQAADAQYKVAVVNVQKILQKSPRVTDLSKKLENEFKARQTKITDGQKVLQAQFEKFRKDAPTMSKKDKEATEKKIEADKAELVKQVVAYQQDLQKQQGNVMQSILSDLNSVVTNIAKAKSYNLVLDTQAVIYSADTNDITDEVAKEFNDKR